VTIGLSSSDPGECVPGAASAVLDGSNWNTGVMVTVQAVDDADDDGTQPCTIVTAPAVSADGDFDGLDPSDVALQVADDGDAAGVQAIPVADLATTECGGETTFTLVLTSQPAAEVTIGLASNDPGEGTVLPAAVTFTPADWNIARTVTVTGQNDPIIDGDVAYSILTSLTSLDPAYAAIDPPDIALINLDGDRYGDPCDLDDDDDGVADVVEQAAPHGGDGNFDGLPDFQQGGVASLRSPVDKSMFVTLDAVEPFAPSGCAHFFNVRAIDETSLGNDAAWDFPFGLFQFSLPCSTARLVLRFQTTKPLGAVYRQHPLQPGSGTWSFARDVLVGIRSGAPALEMTLVDGADGDPVEPGPLIEVGGGPAHVAGADRCPSPPAAPCADPRTLAGSRRQGVGGVGGPSIVGTHRVKILSRAPGGVTVEYSVLLENRGPAAQRDNPGPELITYFPPCTQIDPASISVSSGSAQICAGGVRWDGELPPITALRAKDSTARITVVGTTPPDDPILRSRIQPAKSAGLAAAQTSALWWQSMILSDTDQSGDNETLSLTDDPDLPGEADPTPVFVEQEAEAVEIPAVSAIGLLALTLLLALAASRLLR
jgi:hypothetical protein